MTIHREPGPQELFSSRLVQAPPALVYRAFAEADHLKNWWGPQGFRNTFHAFNFVADGAWHFTMHGPDGTDYDNLNRFVQVDPDQIVIEHVHEPHFVLTITLTGEAGGTRVTWSMLFDSTEIRNEIAKYAVAANEQNFDRLQAELARMG